MPSQTLKLKCVTQILADGSAHSELPGVPEVSVLHESERKARSVLLNKARRILADPELAPITELQARQSPPPDVLVERDAVDLPFTPSRTEVGWHQPVTVTVRFLRWLEGSQHHAFVPGLGLRVFSSRAEQLAQRVEEHVRLAIAAQPAAGRLSRLARLSQADEIVVSELAVDVAFKTPRQIDQEEAAAGEKPSVLPTLAEELPPRQEGLADRANGGSRAARTGSARRSSRSPRGSAGDTAGYELEGELRALAERLTGPHRRSILLLGPPGCGKTALVREFARRRAEFGLGATAFWSTTGARLMVGPIGFGLWQERCQALCQELAKAGGILHLGSLPELLEVGRTSRSELSVAGFLRPWIARGQLLVLAECHPDQVSTIERQDPHLLGAFAPMVMAERSAEQTQRILARVLAEAPGEPDPVPDQTGLALDRLQRLHQRYATYSASPGRPLRFLRHLLDERFPQKSLAESHVIQAFARATGLPPLLLDDAAPLELEPTRAWFNQRVLGQPAAVQHVLDVLTVIKAALGRPRKPLASLLFIGPTGTGKTEMAKALAEFLYGDAGRLARFDLNEFNDPISVQRLIGGPAAGQPEGLLTAKVREQPFSLILLDEFEKADPAFFDLLLQILGDGRLTDAAGRVADFCNSVIVITSNLGAQTFQRGPSGFRAPEAAGRDANEHFAEAVRRFLRPEIYNRFDSIVPFHGLTRDTVLAIARGQLEHVRQRDGLRLRAVNCVFDPTVAEWLAVRGYDPRYGARPLKRTLERELVVPLAEALNAYSTDQPLQADVTIAADRLQVRVRAIAGPDPSGGHDAGGPEERDVIFNPATLARDIVELRRKVGRLRRSGAMAQLEDDRTLLESLERRTANPRGRAPDVQARLRRLPGLQAGLSAADQLAGECAGLETEALGSWYRREAIDPALFQPELDRLEQERRQLIRRLFRLGYETPDEIVLAFFGAPREGCWEFASLYLHATGRTGAVDSMEMLLPAPPTPVRAKGKVAAAFTREAVRHPARQLGEPVERAVGLVLRFRGELMRARLEAEVGLHVIEEARQKRFCLVQEVTGPIDKIEPPPQIDRPGAIKSLGGSVIRTFRPGQSIFVEAGGEKRDWSGSTREIRLAERFDERLEQKIQALFSSD